MLNFFKSGRAAEAVEKLHEAIVEGARRPALYLEAGVPDTPFGRIESVMLHALVVVRRLRALPAPAPAMAQDLVDRMFADFDRAFRQIGIGDMGVPKKMKALGGDWLARLDIYSGPLDAGDEAALAAALARNVMGHGGEPAAGRPLARHAFACERALAKADWPALQAGAVVWPPIDDGAP